MLTGEIRGQIDRIWDSFWTGGISNPLRRLDELQTLEDLKASRLNQPAERRIFLLCCSARPAPPPPPPRRWNNLQTLEDLKASRLNQPAERRIFLEGKDS